MFFQNNEINVMCDSSKLKWLLSKLTNIFPLVDSACLNKS